MSGVEADEPELAYLRCIYSCQANMNGLVLKSCGIGRVGDALSPKDTRRGLTRL